MMRNGEENLNWPLSVLLFRLTARKQTNNTVNYRKDKQLQKVDCNWNGRGERRTFVGISAKMDRLSKTNKHKNDMVWLSWWNSGLHPAAASKDKMKARSAAGGLLHHLTPLSSSRIQAQTEQTIQSSAQGGVGPSTVIGYEHMADSAHSSNQLARNCSLQ